MVEVRVINCLGACVKKNEVADMYSIEEVKAWPNISNDEIESCEECNGSDIVGFVKSIWYKNEDPNFTPMYKDDVEVIA